MTPALSTLEGIVASAFHLEEVLPDAAVGQLGTSRRPAGTSPQGMAVTLLADYSLRTRAWMPSSAIVALLAESGVTPGAARTALSRLARRGGVEGVRQGRQAYYRLTPPAARALAAGGREIVAFAAEAEAWDGTWSLIAFSVPQHGDTARHALRSRLRWMGYAPLYDAVWISPHGLSEKAAVALADFDVATMTVFEATQIEFEAMHRDPLDAWDLASIGARYHAFLQRWRPLLPRIRSGEVGGAEAVRARTGVMDGYRQFVVLDPRLPMRTMPVDWPRAEAYSIFSDIYDGLAERALDHVREVVTRHVPDPQPGIRPHTVAELRAGLRPGAGAHAATPR